MGSTTGTCPAGQFVTALNHNATPTCVAPTASTLSAIDVSSPTFCQDAGSSDSYACALSPAISGYTVGTRYRFRANTVNTGVATLSLNGLTATTIKKVTGGITTDLADSDIRSGQWVDVVYDGTNFQMQSPLGNAPASGGGSSGGGLVVVSNTAVQNYTSATTRYQAGLSAANVSNDASASTFPAPISGTIKNLRASCSVAVAGGTLTFTARNMGTGTDTPLTCQIAPGGTSCTDLSNTYTVNAGDFIGIKTVGGTGLTGGSCYWQYILQ